MTFTNTIKVDVGHPWKTAQVYVKQGDKDSRKIRAELMNGAASWTIPVGTVATFRAKKPDGTIVTQDATIGSPNIVEVVLNEQVGAVFGVVRGEIRLVNGGEILNTFLIAINVEAAAVTDGDIVSRDVLDEYQALVDQMLAVAGSPLVANAAADMTDKTRVYVYTGSEVGYVTGDWYFWDGAAWTAGGVYNSQGIGDAFIEETAQYIKQMAVATESDSTPYLYRPTPNPSAILADEEIVGGTIAHNQLMDKTGYPATTTINGITFTNNNDGSISVSGVASAQARYSFSVVNVPKGHKVLMRGCPAGGVSGLTGGYTFMDNMQSSNKYDNGNGLIYEITNNNNNVQLHINVANGTNIQTSVKFIPQYKDLTAEYGSQIADYLYTLESGTAGAGVAKLREWGFLSKDYFAYDAGSLKSVNTEGKRVVGKNIFDADAIVTSSGHPTNCYVSDGYLRFKTGNPSVNGIQWNGLRLPCPLSFHGTARNFDASNTNTIRFDAYFDDGTTQELLVQTSMPANASKSFDFTIGTAGKTLLRLYSSWMSARDAGLLLSDTQLEFGSTATSFVPYRVTTYPTTPTDLNGIFKLDSNNNLYADGDVYKADGTVTRRYAIADLTDFSSWNYQTNANYVALFKNLSDLGFPIPSSDATARAEAIIPNFTNVTGSGNPHGTFTIYSSGVVYFWNNDGAYADKASMIAAMNAIAPSLLYAVATPTTETATPYTACQIVGKGGTEEWIDNRAVPVPVGHNTTYYIGVPDVPVNASAATLKATVSGGKTTLSWS